MQYRGDFAEDAIVYLMFNTFTSDDPSASSTITNLLNTDVHIHKDDGLTQRNNAAGITVSINFDGITGSHMIKIDTSDDTVAGFWVTGSDYFVRIEGTTIDAAVINAVVGHFSIENRFNEVDVVKLLGTAWLTPVVAGTPDVNMKQISGDATAADNLEAQYDTTGYTEDSAPATQEQVGRLSTAAGGLGVLASSFAKDGAEPETNDYTYTHEGDESLHIVEDDAGVTGFHYGYDVGGNGVATSFYWKGYVQSQGDAVAVKYYNWATSTYKQIKSLDGVAGTTLIEDDFRVPVGATGTGANLGLVRLRFESTESTAIATDITMCVKSVITKSVGYSNGSIYLNTNKSNENTEPHVDGVADNAVSTWAAIKTLSAALEINQFDIANGSSFALDSDSTNYTLLGCNYTLALGGQVLENTHIEEALVSGLATAGSGEIHFKSCHMGDCTLGKAHTCCSALEGTITLSAAATYIFNSCYASDGLDPPIIDFNDIAATVRLSSWDGGIKVKNMAAGSKITIQGMGKLTIDITCDAGGTIGISGNMTRQDDVSGGFSGTINEDARIDVGQINAECDTALTDYDPPTRTEATSDKDAVITEVNANETKIDALNDLSAADVNAECDQALADYEKVDKLTTALINKMIVTETNGNTEQFSDADVSLGSIAAAFSSDGTYTTRKRMVI